MPSKAGGPNVYQLSSDPPSSSTSESPHASPPKKTPSPPHAARNNAEPYSGNEYCTRSKSRPGLSRPVKRPSSTVFGQVSKKQQTRRPGGSDITRPSSHGPQVAQSIDLEDEIGDLVNHFIDKSSAKNDADTLGSNKDKTTFEGKSTPEKQSTNAEVFEVLRLADQAQALQNKTDDITRLVSSKRLSLEEKTKKLEEFRKKREGVQQQIKELEQQMQEAEREAKEIEDLEVAAQRDIDQYKTEIKEGDDHKNRYLEAISGLKEKAAPHVKAFQTTIAILNNT